MFEYKSPAGVNLGVKSERDMWLNPLRTEGGGGGVFHQARGFLPITLKEINAQSRLFLKFNAK